MLAFIQPTTVDKEPLFINPLQLTKSLLFNLQFRFQDHRQGQELLLD